MVASLKPICVYVEKGACAADEEFPGRFDVVAVFDVCFAAAGVGRVGSPRVSLSVRVGSLFSSAECGDDVVCCSRAAEVYNVIGESDAESNT